MQASQSASLCVGWGRGLHLGTIAGADSVHFSPVQALSLTAGRRGRRRSSAVSGLVLGSKIKSIECGACCGPAGSPGPGRLLGTWALTALSSRQTAFVVDEVSNIVKEVSESCQLLALASLCWAWGSCSVLRCLVGGPQRDCSLFVGRGRRLSACGVRTWRLSLGLAQSLPPVAGGDSGHHSGGAYPAREQS